MKYTRKYCFGGFEGKAGADDFIIGYQAENGDYIKCEFSISVNRAIGYTVYRTREEAQNGKGKYIRAFDKLAEAKSFVEAHGND